MGNCQSTENQIRYHQQQEDQIMLQNQEFSNQIAALQDKLASFEGMSKEIKSLKKKVVKIEAEKAELASKLEAVSVSANHGNHGDHDHDHDHHGHDHEEEECPFGQHQSPINIVTTSDGVSTVDLPDGEYKASPLTFSYPHKVRNCSILNNGHTVQINIGEENECTVTVKGKTYTLRQFHFHTPSEHMLDDRQYEMEMHLVHTNEEGEIAVLGFIFTVNQRYQKTTYELSQHRHGMGAVGDDEDWDETTVLANGIIEGNDFLKQFWNQLPAKKTKRDIPLTNDISFDHLFEASCRSVRKSKQRGVVTANMEMFQYDGSLTTPPYTEGVSWMVCKVTHFINQKQLRQLSACWGNKNNARDCQDYFGRKVHLRNKHYMKVDQERWME